MFAVPRSDRAVGCGPGGALTTSEATARRRRPNYFEDLQVGQTFTSATYEVTAAEIIAFARQFDPQPAHTDPEAAPATFFGRHVTSGWHTAAITMRLYVESELQPAGGTIGAGVDSLQWRRPVVPGDVLHLAISIVELRASRSKPDRGIVKVNIQTLNAANEVVQDLTCNNVVLRRVACDA